MIGKDLISNISKKDPKVILKEFNDKIECSSEMFSLLENYEQELYFNFQKFKQSKESKKISTNKKLTLVRGNIFINENIKSPIIIKLLIRHSINLLLIRSKNEPENKNINILINELNILQEKISNYEINIDDIKIQKINQNMLSFIKKIFNNLLYIYHKNILHKNFQ